MTFILSYITDFGNRKIKNIQKYHPQREYSNGSHATNNEFVKHWVNCSEVFTSTGIGVRYAETDDTAIQIFGMYQHTYPVSKSCRVFGAKKKPVAGTGFHDI